MPLPYENGTVEYTFLVSLQQPFHNYLHSGL